MLIPRCSACGSPAPCRAGDRHRPRAAGHGAAQHGGGKFVEFFGGG
jgi:hypothetical protein